jgi:hypothetical protein
MARLEEPLPPDVLAWLVLFEAWLVDRDNDELAGIAGGLLLDILERRGVTPCERQRSDRLKQP